MTRLPTPGSDSGTWGTILNAYLQVSLTSSGAIRPTALTQAGGMIGTNNLSDLQSATTARSNLGLGSAALLNTPIPASYLPSATTTSAGIVELDGTSTDVQPLGTQAAGAVGKAADAGHVHPTTGLMTSVADAGATGIALINGTQTLCTWTAPNDGKPHPVVVAFTLVTTSSSTGGAIGYTFTDPSGTVRSNIQILAGNQGVGAHMLTYTTAVVAANGTFSVDQISALTAGAGTAYANLLAL